jgi:hypothetical protein
MMLTGAEEALLRAALDRYPDPSDWKAAAQQFFASQRTRAVDAADVRHDTFVDWGATTLPFGKFEGQAFRDADPGYLPWLRRWLEKDAARSWTSPDVLLGAGDA